jgi:hypothetical protein
MLTTTSLPRTTHQQDQGTDQPKLHAFPAGSDVALCGKRKAQGEGASATTFCRACENAATSVNHRG